MHDQPNQAGDPAEQDRRDQATVLSHVLSLHPESLTLAELVRELEGEGVSFSERDRIERAVRDLEGVGLVRRACELVLPTRAAVAFGALACGL